MTLGDKYDRWASPPPSPKLPDSEYLWLRLPKRPFFPLKMEILHPKRILAVSLQDDGLASKLIRWFLTHDIGLTNTAPSKTGDTIAGTTHNYPIKTAYYKAEIPIWLDEVTDPKAWSSEFLKPEAREVLTVIGAFIVCFRWPIDEAGLKAVKFLLENVREVVKEGCGYGWDGVCLAVAMPQSTTPYLEKSFEEWEGICQDSGFEFIDFVKKGRNEFSGKSVHDF
jgi:hypothetical protein